MNTSSPHKRFSGTKKLLVFVVLLFLLIFLFAIDTTAVHPNIRLGWSIMAVFIKSYIGIIGLYFGFMTWSKIHLVSDTYYEELQQAMHTAIRTLQHTFLVIISLQIALSTWELWHQLKLYPIELGIWESIWTLIRYLIGLIGTWVLEIWFWIGKQLRISFLLNNPCIGGICLKEYPWVSLLLSAMLAYIFKQLWNISFVRGILRFSFRLFYRVIRVVAKFLLQKVSAKAASHLSTSLLITVGKETVREVHSMYLIPENTDKEEPQKSLE